MIRVLSLSALVLGLAASAAWADHGKGTVGGHTINPRTLHAEDASADFGLRYQRSERFSDQTLLDGAANGHDVHSADWLAEFSASASVGVTDHFTISLSVPFEVLSGFRAGEDDPVNGPSVVEANSVVGLGDMSLLGKVSFVASEIEMAVLVGVKVPTGVTDREDNEGNPLEPDHQPGTGSWDPLLGFAAMEQFERFSIGGSLFYRYTTEGRREFRPGQQLTVALKGEYQVAGMGKFPRVYVSLELVEQVTAMDREDDVRNHDTGGSILTLGPGIRVRANDHVTFSSTLSFPIYQGLYGLQHKERFEFLFGTGVDF
jgi:hypothetical protein